ncbi:MAG: 2-oxoacid:acceptor oxidoreductase family protein [Candidatus Omnitrophota bacterium]
MQEQIIIAGAGGQGIVLLGRVIAEAALKKGLNVTGLPAYGAAVRGGTSYYMVTLSSTEVASPYIRKADTLIIMNEPSLIKFRKKINNKGLLLINTSLVEQKELLADNKSVTTCALPFTDSAIKLGNIKVANMIAFGAYIGKKKIFTKQMVFKVIEEIAPPGKKDLIWINQKAIEEGMRLADDAG